MYFIVTNTRKVVRHYLMILLVFVAMSASVAVENNLRSPNEFTIESKILKKNKGTVHECPLKIFVISGIFDGNPDNDCIWFFGFRLKGNC